MDFKKENCWEFMKCGREPGGDKSGELGICPSSLIEKMDGFHGGKNGGRICWLISGTLCTGTKAGTYAQKIDKCLDCLFYSKVKNEEENEFFESTVKNNKNGTNG